MSYMPYLDRQLGLARATDLVFALFADDPTFAGSVVNAKANLVTVYRASDDPVPDRVHEAAKALLPVGAELGYGRARFSRGQVDELNALVESLLPELDAEGARVTVWGQLSSWTQPSYVAPYVVNYYADGAVPSRRLQAMFDRFGEGNVLFEEGGIANIANRYSP